MTSNFGRLCVAIAVLSAIALSGYLIMLARRTDWFDRTAAVGADVALFVAAACAVAVGAAFLAVRASGGCLPTLRWLLAFNAAEAAIYLILFIAGKFGPVVKP